MRIFFYGHAAGLGAGHFARSLRLAQAAREAGAEVMVTHPGPELEVLNQAEIPLLPLPPLRGLSADLTLVEARGTALLDGLRGWRPDVVVVDTLPFGQGGELLASLGAAHEENWPVRFWWGLPYAESKVGPLKNPRLKKALARYHGMLVYTEPDRYDPVPAYAHFPPPPRVHHVGMVTEAVRTTPSPEPRLACLVGSGGLAGAPELLRAVARQCPEGVALRYVAGPLAQSHGRLPKGVEVLPEANLEQALRGASAVISRAGYNSAYSLMRTDLPVLLVPTAWPEQFQRAEQLAGLDGVLVLPESELEPGLGQALERLLQLPRLSRQLPFRVDGAQQAARLLLQADCDAAEA